MYGNISEYINTDKKLSLIVHGERVVLTLETILKTNKRLAESTQRGIDEGLSGKVYINPERFDIWLEDCNNRIEKYLKGDFKLWMGYYQEAYYTQTNKCVGILG